MKRGKVVFAGFILMIFLFASLGFIFAEEGELAAAKPADVSVSLSNSVPTIVSWTRPDYDSTNGATFDAWPPTACSTTTVQRVTGVSEGLVVTISDANGYSDLDDTASVTVTITGSVTVNPTCTLIGPGSGPNEADFHCTFDMDFFNEGGLSNNWDITVTAVTDDSGGSASGVPLVSDGSATQPYFNFGTLVDLDISDEGDPGDGSLDTLTWSGVQTTSTDVNSDQFLIVRNCGNIDIDGTNGFSASDSYITVRGRDLVNPGATDYMEPDTFFVDEATDSCDTGVGQQLDNVNNLGDDSGIDPISVLDLAIPTGESSNANMYFCLESINPDAPGCTPGDATKACRGKTPITVDSYTTVTNKWQIDACESGCPSDVAP